MFKTSIKKYRALLISITLFLVLFIAVVSANFIMQTNIVSATQHKFLVQNLLTQSKSKNLPEVKKTLALLNESSKNLNAKQVILVEKSNELLKQNVNNGNLLSTVSELEGITNSEFDRKQRLNSYFLAISIIFAITIYLAVLLQVIKKLNAEDESQESSKEETENIMSTVTEGLFLLGQDLKIGVEQSKSLKEMFDLKYDLQGNFIEFMRKYCTESDIENARDYIEILFGDRVKEKLIADLNPLTKVKVHIKRLDGSINNRYLKFNFKRVIKGGKLLHLLVSTTDITKQAVLEQELEDTKEKQESQINLLMSILHVDNQALSSFFESTEKILHQVNDSLKETGYDSFQLKRKVNSAYENIHLIKGDAASLGLHKFEALAHEVEEGLSTLKHKAEIKGQDLLDFTVQLKSLFAELEQMMSLVEKMSSIKVVSSNSPVEKTLTENQAQDNTLQRLANTVAERNKKPVTLSTYGFSNDELPAEFKKAANDISIQLIRNSIVHGIEDAKTRLENGKPSIAQIVCNLTKCPNGGYELMVKDDGAGINEQSIISKALKMNLIKESQVEDIKGKSKIVKLLFSNGLTTREDADLDAGRGVGLALVHKLSKEYHGRISVGHSKGRHCCFKITFPPITEKEVNFQ